MWIGVPRERKNHEFRVGLIPAAVKELVSHGHQVVIEQGAGQAIGFTDEHYRQVGALIEPVLEALFQRCELIIKVKEPQAVERALLQPHHTLLAYLHLAADHQQTQDLMQSGACCIAFETVTGPGGGLPLLAPMSAVAGRMAIQAGARCLENAMGGRGLLLGGVPGVAPAQVVIIGAGVVGQNAAAVAAGMGAQVSVLDTDVNRLRALERRQGNRIVTLYSTAQTIEDAVIPADLVIGGVLLPGAAAPRVISRELVGAMKTGSVIVDVAIDQGGCVATSRATCHDDPTFVVDGVVHYCVANMPGAVARTATLALNNATLPYILQLADRGIRGALMADPGLLKGVNVCSGQLTQPSVALAHGMACGSPESLVGALP